MMRQSTRLGREHRRPTAVSALRYALGTALIVAILVGSAAPALATTVAATCDGWSVFLDGYDPDANKTVSIFIDGDAVMEHAPFENGFNLPNLSWSYYRDDHSLVVVIGIDGVYDQKNRQVNGCPTSAPPTTDVTATCDGWSVLLDGFDPNATKTVTIQTDGVRVIDAAPFPNGFNLPGPWPTYRDQHYFQMRVVVNGSATYVERTPGGCPTSAPPTTAPAPPTTAPAPPTTAPPTTQPTPGTTVAETPETTTTAPSSSTASTPTATTTVGPSTTVDVGTTETGPSDTTVVAAVETEPPSGSNTASLLIGLLAGLVLAGVGGGAWYFGRRSTQN